MPPSLTPAAENGANAQTISIKLIGPQKKPGHVAGLQSSRNLDWRRLVLLRGFSVEAKRVRGPAGGLGSQTRQFRTSLGRPLVRAFAEGTTEPPSGDPLRLALVFCGVTGLTAASPCPAALHAASHARPGKLRAVSHASPGDLHAALDDAPSQPSRRQLVTRLAVAPLSLATIGARRAPQPSIRRHR
jgi:hypothetical protein